MKKKHRTLKFIKRLTLKWFIPGTGNYISNQKQTNYNEKFGKKIFHGFFWRLCLIDSLWI